MRISDLKKNDPIDPVAELQGAWNKPKSTRIAAGDEAATAKFVSMAEFAAMWATMGGEVVGFVDEAAGINYDEATIKAMIEASNGRSI